MPIKNNINILSRIAIIIAVMCMLSCKKTQGNSTDNIESIGILNKEHPLEITLQDIVDSIKYIPLETSSACLLGEVNDIKEDSGLYFVRDNRGLYVFNEKGHFVNEIGRRGQGPDEYIYMDFFYLDRKSKMVYIICNVENKIKQYTYDGQHVRNINLDKKDANISSAMLCKNGNLLAYYPLPNSAFEEDSEYKILSETENVLKSTSLLPAFPFNSGEIHYPFIYYPMAHFNGKYYFISVLSNLLYVYEQEKIVPAYKIDLPDIAPDADYLNQHKDLDFFALQQTLLRENIGNGLTRLLNSDSHLFISINNSLSLIWNGKESILISKTYDKETNCVMNLALSGSFSIEHLGNITAESLCEQKEYILEAGSKDLQDIVQRIAEDDNPVICRHYIKKDAIEVLKKMIHK